MNLDDYITGTYDPDAPFNRPDYKCPCCFWEGDECDFREPDEGEEVWEEFEEDGMPICPECGEDIDW